MFHLDAIKKALPRDSSALVIVGDTKICDAMVDMFKSYAPELIRRDVVDELRKRLQALHDQVAQSFAEVEAAAPPPR